MAGKQTTLEALEHGAIFQSLSGTLFQKSAEKSASGTWPVTNLKTGGVIGPLLPTMPVTPMTPKAESFVTNTEGTTHGDLPVGALIKLSASDKAAVWKIVGPSDGVPGAINAEVVVPSVLTPGSPAGTKGMLSASEMPVSYQLPASAPAAPDDTDLLAGPLPQTKPDAQFHVGDDAWTLGGKHAKVTNGGITLDDGTFIVGPVSLYVSDPLGPADIDPDSFIFDTTKEVKDLPVGSMFTMTTAEQPPIWKLVGKTEAGDAEVEMVMAGGDTPASHVGTRTTIPVNYSVQTYSLPAGTAKPPVMATSFAAVKAGAPGWDPAGGKTLKTLALKPGDMFTGPDTSNTKGGVFMVTLTDEDGVKAQVIEPYDMAHASPVGNESYFTQGYKPAFVNYVSAPKPVAPTPAPGEGMVHVESLPAFSVFELTGNLAGGVPKGHYEMLEPGGEEYLTNIEELPADTDAEDVVWAQEHGYGQDVLVRQGAARDAFDQRRFQ